MRCVSGTAEASQAWHCNYNAIVTDGPLPRKISVRPAEPKQRTNSIYVGSIAFIHSKRDNPACRTLPSYSIIGDSRRFSFEGSKASSEKVRSSCTSIVAASGYAVGNSIPASTEANLSRPDKGRRRTRDSEELYEYKTFPGLY